LGVEASSKGNDFILFGDYTTELVDLTRDIILEIAVINRVAKVMALLELLQICLF